MWQGRLSSDNLPRKGQSLLAYSQLAIRRLLPKMRNRIPDRMGGNGRTIKWRNGSYDSMWNQPIWSTVYVVLLTKILVYFLTALVSLTYFLRNQAWCCTTSAFPHFPTGDSPPPPLPVRRGLVSVVTRSRRNALCVLLPKPSRPICGHCSVLECAPHGLGGKQSPSTFWWPSTPGLEKAV